MYIRRFVQVSTGRCLHFGKEIAKRSRKGQPQVQYADLFLDEEFESCFELGIKITPFLLLKVYVEAISSDVS